MNDGCYRCSILAIVLSFVVLVVAVWQIRLQRCDDLFLNSTSTKPIDLTSPLREEVRRPRLPSSIYEQDGSTLGSTGSVVTEEFHDKAKEGNVFQKSIFGEMDTFSTTKGTQMYSQADPYATERPLLMTIQSTESPSELPTPMASVSPKTMKASAIPSRRPFLSIKVPSQVPTPIPTRTPTTNPTTAPSPSPTPAPTDSGSSAKETLFRPGLQESCHVPDTSRFNICLDLVVSNDTRLAAFEDAKNLWERAIVGQTYVYRGAGNMIKQYTAKGTRWATDVPNDIDDMYIAGFEIPIDGPGRILGSAAPQFINRRTKPPITGEMRFDADDVERLQQKDPSFWVNLITHEMGHVLGFGTMWEDHGLLKAKNDNGKIKYTYLGKRAQEEWEALGCTTPVPIEDDGGIGTAGGHFDEFCMRDELMTGFLSVGNRSTFLSRITVGSLEDFGFNVSYDSTGDYDSSKVNPDCCQPKTRSLRQFGDKTTFRRHRKALTPEQYEIAAHQAALEMKEARDHYPVEIPEDLLYVGGEKTSIFLLEDDGTIQEATFHWSEVHHQV